MPILILYLYQSICRRKFGFVLGLTYTNNKLKINGIIPFILPTLWQKVLGVAGSEVCDPALNVDELSPCLIFQGTHDGLVNSAITEQLLEEYQNSGNTECAIIYKLYGGHSSDIYFSGYYNQIFLYYMERFMFQYR